MNYELMGSAYIGEKECFQDEVKKKVEPQLLGFVLEK